MVKTPIFKGSCTAIVTPFDEHGINFDKMKELIDFQYDNGTSAIVVCGTTGENATMTQYEHEALIEFVCRYNDSRMKIIAGVGSNDTKKALRFAQCAMRCDADGILMVTPYYNKTTQKGLAEHFTYVADRVDIPMIVYNVPSRTGCNILPETIVRLCKNVENIVGVKEASGNISQIAHLAAIADGCVDIYSGNDDQIVPIMSLGGLGVISVLSNVAPAQTHAICQNYLDGNVKESLKLQLEAMELCNALFCEVNPIPVKKALKMMGMIDGSLRMPLTEMEPGNAKRLEEAMKGYGIL